VKLSKLEIPTRADLIALIERGPKAALGNPHGLRELRHVHRRVGGHLDGPLRTLDDLPARKAWAPTRAWRAFLAGTDFQERLQKGPQLGFHHACGWRTLDARILADGVKQAPEQFAHPAGTPSLIFDGI
jgi:hypothetical protein